MRSTVRIDDDILDGLRQRAETDRVSLTRALNDTLRAGLAAAARPPRRRRYREKPLSLGEPRVDLLKALALATDLEDRESVRKLALRK